jgi:hypothetical protein
MLSFCKVLNSIFRTRNKQKRKKEQKNERKEKGKKIKIISLPLLLHVLLQFPNAFSKL